MVPNKRWMTSLGLHMSIRYPGARGIKRSIRNILASIVVTGIDWTESGFERESVS